VHRQEVGAASRAARPVRLGSPDLPQHPQQTGVLFIIRQQVQPALHMQAMQSQHDWIISQHLASPEVQVTQMPLSVISHLHMPIVKLQQQTIRPFIITQHEHMPPASMEQRFCTMPRAIWSSQTHVIFMPPWHFSNLIVQRGTIMLGAIAGEMLGDGMPAAERPAIAIPVRSIITPFITVSPKQKDTRTFNVRSKSCRKTENTG
jgi:hypothetical protein